MEYNESKVYTALNANKLRVGSKVIVADNILELKSYVASDDNIHTLTEIKDEGSSYRFKTGYNNWSLAYLIEKPETYYVGYDLQNDMLIWHNTRSVFKHVYYECSTLKEVGDWIISHRRFESIMKAYELGKQIQCYDPNEDWDDWCDVSEPKWDTFYKYRIKPEYKRMTNLDLAKWLAKGNGQVKVTENSVLTSYSYGIHDDDEVPKDFLIREWGGIWHEPLLEVENE